MLIREYDEMLQKVGFIHLVLILVQCKHIYNTCTCTYTCVHCNHDIITSIYIVHAEGALDLVELDIAHCIIYNMGLHNCTHQ